MQRVARGPPARSSPPPPRAGYGALPRPREAPLTPPAEYELLRVAVARAGAEALARFRNPTIYDKADGTGVTDADQAAERALVDALRVDFPHDAIVGEEGAAVPGGPRTWYVDPIDGTHAFIEGLAHWGPTLGLVEPVDGASRVLLGATGFPRLGEFWFGARGQGAWRDGQRLPPLRPPSPRAPVLVPSSFFRWFELQHRGKMRSLGSTAAHLLLAASGSAAGAFVLPGWSPWDVVGALILLEEVGGVAKTLGGDQLDPVKDQAVPFLAGHPAAVEALLGALRFKSPRDPGA